jgi:hypothetical protein
MAEQKDQGPAPPLVAPDLTTPNPRAEGDTVLPTHAELVRNGWRLVRHCPAGDQWHHASDHLRGTAEYGDAAGGDHPNAPQWSVKFCEDVFDEFLFATGDGSKWIVVDKAEVEVTPAYLLPVAAAGGKAKFQGMAEMTQPCVVSSSSANAAPYAVGLLHRADHPSEPWIALTDHEAAKSNEGAGFLYGGGDFRFTIDAAPTAAAAGGLGAAAAGRPQLIAKGDVGYEASVVPQEYGLSNVKFRGGANVYIRNREKVGGA